jgi:hypothetical protein
VTLRPISRNDLPRFVEFGADMEVQPLSEFYPPRPTSPEHLMDYAFHLRNVRKVRLSAATTNARDLGCHRACGFVEEGRLREQQWLDGRFVDVVYIRVLRREWRSGGNGIGPEIGAKEDR